MKKESLLLVEECFRNIQQEKNITKNIRLIESAIKREFDIKLKISIIDNKKQFFGMCVYPSPEEIQDSKVISWIQISILLKPSPKTNLVLQLLQQSKSFHFDLWNS